MLLLTEMGCTEQDIEEYRRIIQQMRDFEDLKKSEESSQMTQLEMKKLSEQLTRPANYVKAKNMAMKKFGKKGLNGARQRVITKAGYS